MTINERFRDIRLQLNKTQAEFGEQCGLGRAVIANIENNRSPVTPLYIKVVVDNFGANEEWLRTGEGPMFVETKDDYIEHLVQLYKGGDILRKVINAFIALAPEEQKAVLKFVDNLSPEPEEKVLKIARSSDDQAPEIAKIPKSEIRAALSERAKSDDDLK